MLSGQERFISSLSSHLENPRTAAACHGAISQSILLSKLLQPAPWKTAGPAVGRDGALFNSSEWFRHGNGGQARPIHHPPRCQPGPLRQLLIKLHLARAGIMTKGPEWSGHRVVHTLTSSGGAGNQVRPCRAQKGSWELSPALWWHLTWLLGVSGKPRARRGWGCNDDVGDTQVFVVQHRGLVMVVAAAAADTHLKA